MKETKEEIIKHLESLGTIVPECKGCEEFYKAEDPTSVFAPRHKASNRCRSGKRAHCTCGTCF